jgi:CDP-6-deoxy-D-xylo-4-hexulose-3-dehydrase
MWKLAEDTIDQADLDALADWLRTGPRLTQGELVREFERAWSKWLGVRESVFVSSGTTANFALVQAAAIRVERSRPRVGVAAVTWSTNITPSLLLGHDVCVFDIDRRTLGVGESQVVAAMDEDRLDILFITHLLGFDALTSAIVDAADRNGVILLEDCCESHGARHEDRHVGTVGLGSTFSFYFGHHMSTIEGGMISTDDADLADDLRLLRAHGLARESSRFEDYAAAHPHLDPRFLFILPGLNFRSTELNAFLGLRQLRTLDERIGVRNDNMLRFLERAPEFLWRDFETAGMSSFAFPIVATDPALRPDIQRLTTDLGIETRPVVAGNLLEQPFIEGFDVRTFDGPPSVAQHVHAAGLYAGNGHHVTTEMVDAMCDHLTRLG